MSTTIKKTDTETLRALAELPEIPPGEAVVLRMAARDLETLREDRDRLLRDRAALCRENECLHDRAESLTESDQQLHDRIFDLDTVVARLQRERDALSSQVISLVGRLHDTSRERDRWQECAEAHLNDRNRFAVKLEERALQLTKALSRETRNLGRAQRAEEKLDEAYDEVHERESLLNKLSAEKDEIAGAHDEWMRRAQLAEAALDTINQLRKEGKL